MDDLLAVVAFAVALLLALVVWASPVAPRPVHPMIAPGVTAVPFVGSK